MRTVKQREAYVKKQLAGISGDRRKALERCLLAGRELLQLREQTGLKTSPEAPSRSMETSPWGRYVKGTFGISCSHSMVLIRIARTYKTVDELPAEARTINDLKFACKPGNRGRAKSQGRVLPKGWTSLQRTLLGLSRLDPEKFEQVRSFAEMQLQLAESRKTRAA